MPTPTWDSSSVSFDNPSVTFDGSPLMAIAFTQSLTNQSETDAGSYTTASVAFTAGTLYLVCTNTTKAASPAAPTVATTGGALTFNSVTTKTFGTSCVAVHRALPISPVTDSLLITLASATSCTWHVIAVTGMDTSGTNGSGAIVQTATAGASTTALTVALTNNIVAGNARYTFCGVQQQYSAVTVSSGTWTTGTNQGHANPPGLSRPAWNSTPATTDKSAIWTPGAGTSTMGSIIVELAAASDWSVGMIPL